MKVFLFFLIPIFISASFAQNKVSKPKLFDRGETSICFVGDSITHHGYYPKHIALYYITRYPHLKKEFLNAGFEGGSANTTNLRFNADIAPKKAQIHTLMLGMNDVRHWNFTSKALADKKTHNEKRQINFDTYKSGMTTLVDKLQKNGKVVLLSSSIYDGIGDILDPYAVARNGEIISISRTCGLQLVNDELNRYGQWCAQLAKKRNLLYADHWRETNLANIKVVGENPHSSAIGRNRVHPFDFGGFFTAYAFLKDLGETNIVSYIEIDAESKSVKTKNADVSNVSNGWWIKIPFITDEKALSFKSIEYALPYPLTDNTNACTKYCNFNRDLNRQTLIVRNLEKGEYRVKIDDKIIGFYTEKQLSKGVDLGGNTLTPQAKQAREVEKQVEIWRERTQRVRDVFGTEFIMGVYNDNNSQEKNIEIAKKWIQTNRVSKGSRNSFLWYVDNRKNKDAFQRQADQALQKAYELAKPVLHTYSIEKVDFPKFKSSQNQTEESKNFDIIKDIKYSESPIATIDLYIAKSSTKQKPCIILFHGGNWLGGSKNDTASLAETLSAKGFIVVNAEYTLGKQYKKALTNQFEILKWIERNADTYDIDKNKIATCGFGSGGVMALQLASIANNSDAFNASINDDKLKPVQSHPIAACISISSGHDMTSPERFNTMFACDPPKAKEFSSYTYISKNNPPTLLIHGIFNDVIDVSEALKMANKLDETEIKNYTKFYNTQTHNLLALPKNIACDIENFLNKILD